MFNFQKSTINMKWNRKKKTKTRKTQLTELNRTEMIDIHLQMKKTDETQKKSPVEMNTMSFLEQVFSFLVFFCYFTFFVFHQQKTSDEKISQTSTQTVICFENLILI
jgi:hypothetical protein